MIYGRLRLRLRLEVDSESAESALRAPPPPHGHLPQTVLLPLLSLKSIRHLSLLGPCFSSLHNATLAAIADALPSLWTAALCPDAAHRGVTLAGLGVLAGPEGLRSIQLPLADVGVGERAVAEAFSFRQRRRASSSPSRLLASALDGLPSSESGLTVTATLAAGSAPDPHDGVHNRSGTGTSASRLRCGRARISEGCVEGAAAALSAWFPRLAAANFSVDLDSDEPVLRAMGSRDADDAGEVRRRWEQVGSLVTSFAFVRSQERQWTRTADR